MSLRKSLTAFAETFSKSSENFGIVEVASAPTSVNPPFFIGDVLTEYYSLLVLDDKPQIGGQFQLRLFSLSELEGAQQGRRWVRDSEGKVSENPLWQSSWVTIADRNGDGLFVDSATGSVGANIQSKILRLSESLPPFINALTAGMKIEMDKYNYDVADEDFNLDQQFIDDVNVEVVAELGDEYASAFMEFFFG